MANFHIKQFLHIDFSTMALTLHLIVLYRHSDSVVTALDKDLVMQ